MEVVVSDLPLVKDTFSGCLCSRQAVGDGTYTSTQPDNSQEWLWQPVYTTYKITSQELEECWPLQFVCFMLIVCPSKSTLPESRPKNMDALFFFFFAFWTFRLRLPPHSEINNHRSGPWFTVNAKDQLLPSSIQIGRVEIWGLLQTMMIIKLHQVSSDNMIYSFQNGFRWGIYCLCVFFFFF